MKIRAVSSGINPDRSIHDFFTKNNKYKMTTTDQIAKAQRENWIMQERLNNRRIALDASLKVYIEGKNSLQVAEELYEFLCRDLETTPNR